MSGNKNIDILCVGEALVDFIGHQPDMSIAQTKDYHRHIGGSPTNVAMNMTRLGLNASLVSTIGNDGLGDYILERLKEVNVETSHIARHRLLPTSTVFISRSSGTPDFIPYLFADSEINENQITAPILKQSRVFHTTSFALSRKPAQTTILKKAEEAHKLGCKLSIDINYSEKIWPDRVEAERVLNAYCKNNPLVKISEDDAERLFRKDIHHYEIFDHFHDKGVDIICLTLGKDGVVLSEKGKSIIQKPAKKISEIVDSTGAGDAFWSGFLYSYLNDFGMEKSIDIAQSLSALKLQHVGRLPTNINVISELLGNS